MSTPTPTGDSHQNGHSRRLGDLAAWVPDEASLTKLAADVLRGLAADDAGPAPAPAPAAASLAPASADLLELPAEVRPALPGPPDELPDAGVSQPSFYFVDERLLMPSEASPPGSQGFDVDAVRREFPILEERVNGKQLVWLDNAATTQKPRSVIDRLAYFYAHENSNIHRGAHTLATKATDAYEDARCKVATFLGAPSSDSIVFTRGTTEAINLVAQTWGREHLGPGDEILVSHLEHHANIVPWQLLASQAGAKLKVIPVDDDGQLRLDGLTALLSDRTRLVAVAHVSNVLGTIVPIEAVIAAAHRVGARVLVDGAQAVAHLPVRVQSLDADFYTFSGHKIFGPTGIGALYVKPEILADLPPWQGGGNMISDVTFERTRYQQAPARLEAGTGNIADAIGLGAALDFVTKTGLAGIGAYEHQLLEYATRQICAVPGLRLVGTAPDKASVLTFALDGHDPADLGTALDRQGIAVRAGHHCAQPILRRFGLEAAVRPSLAMYNTCAEVDKLVSALHAIAAAG